jgi:hypothetical protein
VYDFRTRGSYPTSARQHCYSRLNLSRSFPTALLSYIYEHCALGKVFPRMRGQSVRKSCRRYVECASRTRRTRRTRRRRERDTLSNVISKSTLGKSSHSEGSESVTRRTRRDVWSIPRRDINKQYSARTLDYLVSLTGRKEAHVTFETISR